MVIMFKTFSEGEGLFSGMDTDETAWVSVRPSTIGGSSDDALMEVCSRQTPMYYLPSQQTSDATLKEYHGMLEDVSKEDERELTSSLQKLKLNCTSASIH